MAHDEDEDFDNIEETIRKFDDDSSGNKQYFSADEIENLFDHFMMYGEYEQAGKVADRGLELFPSNGELMIDRATVHYFAGELTQAMSLLDTAKLYEPENPDIYQLEGDVYEKLDQNEKAVYCYKKALQNSDHPDDVYMSLSGVYCKTGKHALAIEMLKDIFKKQPENEIILSEIVSCYVSWRKKKECITFLENLIDEYPYSHTAWYQLGKMWQFEGNKEKALNAFEYATITNENFSSAHFSKGLIYEEQGDYEKAIESYTQCLSIDENDVYVSLCIGRCYISLNKSDEAREHLKRATKEDSFFADAWYLIGVSHMAQSQWIKAIPYLKKAKAIDTWDEQYNLAMAACYTEIGNYEEAENLHNESLSNKENYKNYWIDWAVVFYKSERTDIYNEIINRAAASGEYITELLVFKSMEELDSHNGKRALETLESALQRDYEKTLQTLQKINPELENRSEIRYLLDIYNQDDEDEPRDF